MIPTPGPPQRVRAPAGPASSPRPGTPRVAVAARWPCQASKASWPLHHGLARLAGRQLFAQQPHHPPAGNARPQHQQHHSRCLPLQVVLYIQQRAGHRHRRAAHQQPDRVALLVVGFRFQVGSGHGSSPSASGAPCRRRWPGHQVAPVAPSRRVAPPVPSTHGGVAVSVDGAAATQGGQRSGRAIAKNAGSGVGVAVPPHGAVSGRRWPLGLDAPATPPGRHGHPTGGPAMTGQRSMPARIDLHASLPAGTLHPAGPADPSTGGLPCRVPPAATASSETSWLLSRLRRQLDRRPTSFAPAVAPSSRHGPVTPVARGGRRPRAHPSRERRPTHGMGSGARLPGQRARSSG
jgi:hypothetical protein